MNEEKPRHSTVAAGTSTSLKKPSVGAEWLDDTQRSRGHNYLAFAESRRQEEAIDKYCKVTRFKRFDPKVKQLIITSQLQGNCLFKTLF